MTKRSESIAKKKEHIKYGLDQCSHDERVLFVKMYGPQEYLRDNFLFNVDKIADHHLDSVVEKMSNSSLGWAALQVERSIQKRRNNG